MKGHCCVVPASGRRTNAKRVGWERICTCRMAPLPPVSLLNEMRPISSPGGLMKRD